MSAVALGVGRGSPMVSNSADWLLRDEFISDLAAGSVNGTAAEPGPGTRTVTDTYTKLQISAGYLDFISSTAVNDDPQYQLVPASSIVRAAGRLVLFDVVATSNNFWVMVGGERYWFFDALRINSPSGVNLGANLTAIYGIMARAEGSFFVTKASGSQWVLRWITYISTTTPLVPLIGQYSSTSNVGFVRVPAALWLPTPVASDGFGSAFGTTDGLGHAEGIAGGLGSGGNGKTWSNVGGTWSVSGGKAINTTPSGLSQQMSVAQMSTADVFASAALTRADGAVGLALSMDSSSNPANGVLVYLDGTNCKIDKIVGGSTSNVRTTAVTYSAGARLVVRKTGTEYRVYYNDALVGAANTISDAGIANNTLHGLFSTNASNTLDDFVCYATGTGGEYAELDKWS